MGRITTAKILILNFILQGRMAEGIRVISSLNIIVFIELNYDIIEIKSSIYAMIISSLYFNTREIFIFNTFK